MIENGSYEPPSVSDLSSWATEFGLTHPVMADPGIATSWNYISTVDASGSIGLPTLHLIGPGMEVLAVNEGHISASMIEAHLPE